MKKTLGLGRGLDALIDTTHIATAGSSSISEIALSKIYANPDQPRHTFDEEALNELAQSISEHGVISPITLRKDSNGQYMIIAGERRFRAAKIAGLTSIPAYIRTAKDEQVMEWALIENIQREDLDAIEIALAYQRLMDEYNLTQERMSERVGKKRATVANYLRLLKLPAEIQLGIKEKKIDMGHAGALLSLDSPAEQIKLFHEIEANGCSVREVEEMVRRIKESNETQTAETSKKAATKQQSPEFHQLKKQLTHFFQTPVQLTCSAKGSGKISIKFKNEQELERIITIFDKLNN
jgi:ParB family chromosome partitioning protein